MDRTPEAAPARSLLRSLQALWHWLTQPATAIQEPEQRRQVRLLASVLLTVMVLNIVSTLIQLITVPGFWPTAVVLTGALGILLLAYFVSRTRYYYVAAAVFTLLPTVVGVTSVVLNPDDIIAIVFVTIGVLICSIFWPPRYAIALIIVNMLVLLLLPTMLTSKVSLSDISGPLGFVTIMSVLIVVAANHRNLVERDRQSLLTLAVGDLTVAKHNLEVELARRQQLEAELVRAQRLESVGLLAGGIAHDFNNLLTAIRGYTHFAIEGLSANEPVREDLLRSLWASDRAAILVRQLLAFARRQVLEPYVCDLNEQLRETDSLLHHLIGEHIELVLQLDRHLWPIYADPGQIEQVIVNLTVNARDAMPEGGSLTIGTRNVTLSPSNAAEHVDLAPGDYVLMTVSDTGIGMSADIQQHVFEPFFTTKEQGKGTGLGLATCYGIISQHGGYIWLASQPGQGTTFRVYLPRADGAVVSAPPLSTNQVLPRGSETVLVVEDEETVRAVTVRLLTGLGYKVLAASNGGEALQLISNLPRGCIDLILTDMLMPRLSGPALVQQVRAQDAHVRVLYVTGAAEHVALCVGQAEPGLSLLQKPFTASALAHKVRDVLDMRSIGDRV